MNKKSENLQVQDIIYKKYGHLIIIEFVREYWDLI